MKKLAHFLRDFFFLFIFGFALPSHADDEVTVLKIHPQTLADSLPRYGLNLGSLTAWGAEQLRTNVLLNPGLEPIIDRAIVIVGQVDNYRFTDDTAWLARHNHFWSNATYDIRSGIAAGKRGIIIDSIRNNGNRPGEFFSDSKIDALLQPGDVISLTKNDDATPAWSKGQGDVAVSRDIPPGSQGQQSLRLLALPGRPSEILHRLDAISDRAGKVLPITGKWKLAFWARQPGKNATLRVHLNRSAKHTIIEARLMPGSAWKHYEYEFDAQDSSSAGALTLSFTALDDEILIDEIFLGESNSGTAGFRRAVVDTLRSLRPGYLRDWQGQLGDTLENRLSSEFSHHPVRYRPGSVEFHYSLPDFLNLCQAVDAQPWVIAPTTLSDEEWRKLGSYLRTAADRYGFKEVLVEFGNENWNAIFRPAGIPNPKALSQVADRGFRLLREGSRNDPRIHTVINAQFVNPENVKQVSVHSRETEIISIAPYFMYQQDATTPPSEAIRAAFSDDMQLMTQEVATASRQGKRISVYEVNFHTTGGDATSEQRNLIITSGASGAALARRLLQATLSGIREQAVYTLAGFDNFANGNKSLVRLWGITRDLSIANRFRPTGLALLMLNQVASGQAQALTCTGNNCPELTGVAFSGGKKMAIVSSAAQPAKIRLTLSCQNEAPYILRFLDGTNLMRNNEYEIQVNIEKQTANCRDSSLKFTIPPYSLVTLEPTKSP